MASIENFLSGSKTYSADYIRAYKNKVDRITKQQEEINKQIEEARKQEEEREAAYKRARTEYGIQELNDRINAEQEVWNGGTRVFNTKTNSYERPIVILNRDNSIAYTNLDNIDRTKTIKAPKTGGVPGASEALVNVANATSLGAIKAISDSDVKNKYAEQVSAKANEIQANKEELVKTLGEDRYNKLLQEANTYAKGSLEGYGQDVKFGELSVQRNRAWDQYYKDGTYVSRQKAEELDRQLEEYQNNNLGIGKQTFSATANQLPQFAYQIKKNAGGAILAAGAYALASKLGVPSEAAKAVAAKVYGTTAVASGFGVTLEQTRGAELGDMLKLGIPEDIARDAAQSSAVIQAIIEESEEAIDIRNAFKVPQSKAVTDGLKQVFKNWGVNIVTEGAQEGAQSIVGFVYEKDALNRAGMDTSDYTFGNMMSQAWEEAKGGAEVGATMYIADGLPHIVVGAATNARNQRLAIQDAPILSAQINMPTVEDDFGNITVKSMEDAKKALIEAYDEQVEILESQKRTAPEKNVASIERAIEITKEGKKKVTTDKAVKALVDETNKIYDAQATNKKQTLNKTTQEYADTILGEEQKKARAKGFNDMVFKVADKITTGQKNVAKFAKTFANLNIVYYDTENYKNDNGTYKHRGFWKEGDTVFVNSRVRTTKNVLSVVGHEYAHVYIDGVKDSRKPGGLLDRMYTNQEAIEYGRNHGFKKQGFMPLEEVIAYKEEMFADDVGEFISNPVTVNNIEQGNKTAIASIKNTVANIVENSIGYRPQFDNVSQYNLEGTSVLGGMELGNDTKNMILQDISERSGNVSKKETIQDRLTPDVSKKESSASKLTPEQKSNESWYREQREDNKPRSTIQKSLALRMNKGVNSPEVKAELNRLEKKYNESDRAKRSAEITDTSKSENNFYDADGRRLSQGIVKYDRDSAMRDSNGRLIYWYHTNGFRSYSPFSEINPVGSEHYRYEGQVTFFATNLKKMSLSYAEKSIIEKKDRVTMKQIKQYIDISNAFGVNIGLVKTDGGEYYITDNSKGKTVLKFKNQEDLKRNFRNAIEFTEKIAKNGDGDARTYGGYMNIENPFVVNYGDTWNSLSLISNEEIQERNRLVSRFSNKFGAGLGYWANISYRDDFYTIRMEKNRSELVNAFIEAINGKVVNDPKNREENAKYVGEQIYKLISGNEDLYVIKKGLELSATQYGYGLEEYVKRWSTVAFVDLMFDEKGLTDNVFKNKLAYELIRMFSKDALRGLTIDYTSGLTKEEQLDTNAVVVKVLFKNYTLDAGRIKSLNQIIDKLGPHEHNELGKAIWDSFTEARNEYPQELPDGGETTKYFADKVISKLESSDLQYMKDVVNILKDNPKILTQFLEYSFRTASGILDAKDFHTAFNKFRNFVSVPPLTGKQKHWFTGYSFTQDDILKVGGYDGVWVKNIFDYGGNFVGKMEPADVAIAFDSSQFKLGDNKTPTKSKDIRYSAEIQDNSLQKKKRNGKIINNGGDTDANTNSSKKNNEDATRRGLRTKNNSRNINNTRNKQGSTDTNASVNRKENDSVGKRRTVKESDRANTGAEKWKGKAKKAEQETKTEKRIAKGRGRALRWSWKKEEQQRKQKEVWKARTKKREVAIMGLRAKAKAKDTARKISKLQDELLNKMKRFEKSQAYKFMTPEQKSAYDEVFGNIYRKAKSKTEKTKALELAKARVAQELANNPDAVVSDRVRKLAAAPAQRTLSEYQTVEQMSDLLDAFEKIVEQARKAQELVGLSRNTTSKEEKEEFTAAVKERKTDWGKKRALRESKRNQRATNAVGKIQNALGTALNVTGRTINKVYTSGLKTLETQLLNMAGGDRNSKIMDIYTNLDKGVTRERGAYNNLNRILGSFLNDKRYAQLRKAIHPKNSWKDMNVKVKDVDGIEHELYLNDGLLITLAFHYMQDQSLKHISGANVDVILDEDGKIKTVFREGGGLIIPDMELDKAGKTAEAINEGYAVKLSKKQIGDILGVSNENGATQFNALSKEANELIKTLSDEFFEQTYNYSDEVFFERHGYHLAKSKNYFPIVASKAYIYGNSDNKNLTASTTREAFGIEDGAGFVKDRKDNAFNPIVLENIGDVITRMIDGVSKYYGYEIALHNNRMLLGIKTDDVNVEDVFSKLDPTFKSNYRALEGFISGVMRHPKDLFSWARGKHAEFTLSFNPGSWVKQLLSVPTTAKYFTTKEMVSFIGGGEAALYETMKKYLESRGDYEKGKVLQNFVRYMTDDLDYRNLGFGLADMSDVMENKSAFQKIDIIKGVARFDMLGVNTVTRMFLFAELNRRGLLGDNLTRLSADEADAVFQSVGRDLEHFLRVTQPDYSQANRANITRNSGVLARFMTMYSTPALQMMNNLMQSISEFDYARSTGDKELMGKSFTTLLKSAAGITVASVGSVLISRALSKLWSSGNDDDDEFELGKEITVSMLAPTLVLDDVARGLLGMQQYESQVPELIAFDAATSISSNINGLITGKEETKFNKVKNIIRDLGTLTGIPTRDLMKIGRTVLMYADSDLYYDVALREDTNAYKKWLDGNTSQDTKDFYKAYTATREKVLTSKYGYHKADKEKKIESNKKESFRKALEDVFGKDSKKVNEYMTILGGYKS